METEYFAHDSAYIDEPCEIGKGTRIWHFSHFMPHSKLGNNCVLGQNVHVAEGVVIGNNVKIQNNVSLYTGCQIEDDVVDLAQFATFDQISDVDIYSQRLNLGTVRPDENAWWSLAPHDISVSLWPVGY